MSIAHDYHLSPVHVHINLLGWVSLAVAGIIYTLYPQVATTKLAKIHFWLHNLSLPFMMLGLGFVVIWKNGMGSTNIRFCNHFSSFYIIICL